MTHPHRLWLLDSLVIVRAICSLASVLIAAFIFATRGTVRLEGPDSDVTPVYPSFEIYIAIHFSVHGFLFVNDLSLKFLTRKAYGNIFWTTLVQTAISLSVIVVLCTFNTISSGLPDSARANGIVITLSFAMLVVSILSIWPQVTRLHAWLIGIRDLAYHGTPWFTPGFVSFHWRLREPGDYLLDGFRDHDFFSELGRRLALAINRRTSDIETPRLARRRNITALVIVGFLIVQSIILLFSVVYEDLSVQETWQHASSDASTPTLLIYDSSDEDGCINGNNITMRLDMGRGLDANDSVLISDQQWFQGAPQHVDGTFRLIYPISDDSFATMRGSLDISTIGQGYPCTTWLVPIPTTGIVERNRTNLWDHGLYSVLKRFADPLPLIPGTHSFGVMSVIERKEIHSSFLDMLGFKPKYWSFPLLSIDWIQMVPLEDKEIARITLQPRLGGRLQRVIMDYRRNTFVAALSSLGGLLASVQAIHLLLYGRPLWWGLFGAKLLSPFGLFSGWSYSEDVRKRMIARYGYIPTPETSTPDLRGLSLFLSDFIVDTGPLQKRDEDLLDVEEGTTINGNDEIASSDPSPKTPLLRVPSTSERSRASEDTAYNSQSGIELVQRRPE